MLYHSDLLSPRVACPVIIRAPLLSRPNRVGLSILFYFLVGSTRLISAPGRSDQLTQSSGRNVAIYLTVLRNALTLTRKPAA